jgi:hypothetical protein
MSLIDFEELIDDMTKKYNVDSVTIGESRMLRNGTDDADCVVEDKVNVIVKTHFKGKYVILQAQILNRFLNHKTLRDTL